MGAGYVDVTTRVVDFPSDAGTLAGVWHDIASQLVVNQTLLPALDSLLTALSTLTVSIWGLGLGVKSLLLQVAAVLREQDSTTSACQNPPCVWAVAV